ncbi:MAG TPA: lipoyl(octanoyl) transferase LipB [Anaerolineae bacterium]|jgi:lipoyl(octanoyl) transferase|nr:lipoyl(octanoyl) transferase LipB [Anaerolineae bacterium]
MIKTKCWVVELGSVDYRTALDLQARLVTLRRQSRIPNTLLLLEHPHTYTVGSRADLSNLLLSRKEMVGRGIRLFTVDRGGEITYHGPGQVVGYPIMRIGGIPGIRDYLRGLEDVLIKTISDFNVRAERLPGYPGVWFGLEKVAAIGLRITRGISKHGFALNVSTDLSFFEGIIPCGIHDKGVTSLSEILGREVPISLVQKSVIKHFGAVFNLDLVHMQKEALLELGIQDDQAAAV